MSRVLALRELLRPSTLNNPQSAASDRRNDRDFVPGLRRRVEVLEEADVLVVQVDVDEAIELVGALEQPGLDAAGLVLEAVEHFADVAIRHLDHVSAIRVAAERGGNSDFNAHGWFLVVGLLWLSCNCAGPELTRHHSTSPFIARPSA